MNGLIGQIDRRPPHRRGTYHIKHAGIEDGIGGAYRVTRINYDVPLRKDKVMNRNIKANILEKDKMIELGFVERNFYWEFHKKVSPVEDIEDYLMITIGKEASGINIKVRDIFTKVIYDYQAVLYENEFDEYANKIHHNVQEEVMKLVEAGVILGYERNDYI